MTSGGSLAAALADRYRMERELGAGGMATVYLAEDLKHHRQVAIKVLHPELSALLGPERFLKEIELTASLQHPHILPLFDSGSANGLLYYVMPYVAGETLRGRLARETQLPVADAVRIASEVAGALDYAHRRGVVHRDIKPENILLHDGSALVADFGIALAVRSAGGERMTQTGLSLGTPQYMSPEQAMGEREIGPRSDIYSLGAVAYEMLAGEPPFTGPSAQAIVAKVITEEAPAVSTRRRSVPPAVDDAVRTALEKLPADRFGSAAQFATALSGGPVPSPSGARARPAAHGGGPSRAWLGAYAAALLLAGAAVGAALVPVASRGRRVGDLFPYRIVIGGARDSAGTPTGSAVLSPDGHTVVYVGREPSATDAQVFARAPAGTDVQLFVRRLDQLTARPIPGSGGAASPAFSPDGKWVAFIANRNRILKVALDGGTPVTLGSVSDDGGIDWSSRGDIVVGSGVTEGLGGLERVNPAGGALLPLTRVDTTRGELSHQWPRFLADGRTILFTIWHGANENAEIAAASVADGRVMHLGVHGVRALGVAGGELVYIRGDAVAMAVPFDARTLRVTGTPVPVLDSVGLPGNSGGAALASLTPAGGLAFTPSLENGLRQLVWVDRAGRQRSALSGARDYQFARLSPDGQRAALTIRSGTGADIWILDLGLGTLARLTTTGDVRNPVWSPDGRRILYVSTHGGRAAFWWQPADGSGPPVEAGEARHNPWFIDLAPDGKTVVFNAIYDGSFNLESFVLDSTRAEHDVAASPAATEGRGRFSPDGRLVAYSSDESGRAEVYVRPFPGPGAALRVSLDGAVGAVWGRDGTHLYYRGAQRLMAATIAREPQLRVVSRDSLFPDPYDQEFDVAPGGSRFLMIERAPSRGELVVVPDWGAELRRLTASRSQ